MVQPIPVTDAGGTQPSRATAPEIQLGPGRKYFGLALMTAVYALNLVDRGLMGLLLQPIKVDLGLSDTQLGLVTGIAFALFYATVGVPIARWADRGNRATITSLSIGLWAITVMACLFVGNYVQLLLARIMAAVGEAGCKPPTYSLIGDYFPEKSARTRAMAVYMAAPPIAVLLSHIVGGRLNEEFGWRMTFFLMGIPGIALAVLVKLALTEPRTATRRSPGLVWARSTSMPTLLMLIWQRKALRHLTLALVVFYALAAGLGPWQSAFMIRNHGMGTAELGLWLGVIYSVAGVTGVLLGGHIAAKWFANDEQRQMRMSAFAVAFAVVPFVAFLTLDRKEFALLALVPKVLVFSVFMAPTYVLIQRLVSDDLRSTMMSVILLLANLIGLGLGPQIVGVLSDLYAPTLGKDALRAAMLTMSFLGFWAAFHFWKVGDAVGEDLARARQDTRE